MPPKKPVTAASKPAPRASGSKGNVAAKKPAAAPARGGKAAQGN